MARKGLAGKHLPWRRAVRANTCIGEGVDGCSHAERAGGPLVSLVSLAAMHGMDLHTTVGH